MNTLMEKMQQEGLHGVGTHKIIANTILKNLFQLSKMTITQVSALSFTTPTSITRFSHKMDCKGFKELKTKLFYDMKYNEKINELNQTLTHSEKEILDELLENAIESLHYTNDNSNKKIGSVVKMIQNAKKILVYSTPINHAAAMHFSKTLIMMGFDSSFHPDANTQLAQAKNISNKDTLAFVISTSGRAPLMVKCTRFLHENNSKIISITSDIHSSISTLSDVTFEILTSEAPGRNVSYHSILFTINSILTLLLSNNKNKIIYDEYKKIKN